MVKGELDSSMWLVAIVACVAIVGLAGVIGNFNELNKPGLASYGITAYAVSEPEPEPKPISGVSPAEEPELLPEPAYVYIMPDVQSVKAGDEFTVSVNIAAVSNLYAFHLDIAYDPEVLELVQKQPGPWFTSDGQVQAYCIPGVDSPGKIGSLACTKLGMVSGINGNGVLEKITFKAVAKGESPIELYHAKLSSPDSEYIYLSKINGRVIVK